MPVGGTSIATPATLGAAVPVAGAQVPASAAPGGGGGDVLSTPAAQLAGRTAYAASNPIVSGHLHAPRAPQLTPAALPDLSNAQPQLAAAAPAATAATTAPSGPAAWDETWMKQFSDAGADSQTLQQLFVTGGGGLDRAGLQQVLTQVKQQTAKLYAQFDAKFPGERATLAKTKMTPTQVTDLVQQALSGKLNKRALGAKVDDAYGSSGAGQMRSMLGDMGPYSLVPGWGAISTALGLGNGIMHGDIAGSRNPLSKRQLFGTTMDQVQTPLMAAAGALTLYNLAREQKDLRAGRAAAMVPGSMEAQIARLNGVDPTVHGISALNPFSRENRVLSMLSRYQDFKSGTEHLESVAAAHRLEGKSVEAVGQQAEMSRAFLSSWERGTPVLSDPVMSVSKMGFMSQVRGIIMQRNKPMISVKNVGGLQSAVVSPRLRGGMTAAHAAAIEPQLASGTLLENFLRVHGEPGTPVAEQLPKLSELMLARATRDAFTSTEDSAATAAPASGVRAVIDAIRPGRVHDGVKAIARENAGKLGTATGLAALQTHTKIGLALGGIAAAVGGVMLYMKHSAAANPGDQAQAAQGKPAAGAATRGRAGAQPATS